ncbi:glycosyltransferase family 2 protein [Marinobacterium marinum]|uniref:Glycosyltransferase family 2 protein n=1 Tax=Marinobacterium marinum TaxID=2756129 RepID=A0A7W1X0K7_9GAMM|nr:glycosyltransferase family 2 protein [Marinobacterium marinum]MBA4503643.1 glycosyltransferase family 2 protein [Marinobacterium marinum]
MDDTNRSRSEVTRPDRPSLTCILPAYNEGENLAHLVPRLTEYLTRFTDRIELLIVDDGSQDDTAAIATALADTYPVTLLQLSRNFGKEAALSAGIDHADGDVVLLMDADGQHPLEVVEQFFHYWHQGYDMVYGVRDNRDDESAGKRHLTNLFYRILSRSAEINIHPDAGDFRLLDRKVVLALRQLPERSRMMKGLYAWVGFSSKSVTFTVAPRLGGTSNFRLRHLSALALTGFTSFSSAPLRVWMLLGAGVSVLSLLYAFVIVLRTLMFGSDVPGWPTIAAGIAFLGGIQLFSVGILGEYIARIFSEVKARPLYLVGRRVSFRDRDNTVEGTSDDA